ncbi:GH39 family glycosyl hydrolase [Mucilaginibacter sp.]|uniref:GH39 family glycosyl hydrolase n=1 Tax=Mucilaginibacter sp. TaxID=1882438 RepID=UPI002ED4F3BC
MKKHIRTYLSTILVFPLVINILNKSTSDSPQRAPITVLTVDCSKSEDRPKPMNGFLLSINDKNPPSQLITPLAPAYWRVSANKKYVLDRLDSFQTKPIFLMSDIFHYPGSHPSLWKTPTNDNVGWNDTVKNTFSRHAYQKKKYIYDLWNEPNGKFFFAGNESDFCGVFKTAHDKIRALPNGDNTLISGPSISKFDTAYIHHFLDYCLINNIKLDVLSWHEFRTGDDIIKIKNDLQWVRKNWVNSAKYAPLKIKAIQINEIIAQADQYVPASILAYFYYLEKGGADAACKACWPPSQPGAKTNCFNNSLDGLVDPDTFGTRAAWWIYRYYNLTLQNRLNSTNVNPNVVSFANYSSRKIQILVGYFGDKKPANLNLSLDIKNISALSDMPKKQSFNVQVKLIPNSGEATINSPETVIQTQATVQNDHLTVSLPDLHLKEAYFIEIN